MCREGRRPPGPCTEGRKTRMRVAEARHVAREWVRREASGLPGFQGAYFAGSINWLPDDADLPPTSDLDVNLVIGDGGAPAERHKLVHRSVLLEISHLPLDRVRSPDRVLGDFALAGGFRVPSIMFDPTGHLTTVQATVSQRFAEPAWVHRRCEDAASRMFGYLDALDEAD